MATKMIPYAKINVYLSIILSLNGICIEEIHNLKSILIFPRIYIYMYIYLFKIEMINSPDLF